MFLLFWFLQNNTRHLGDRSPGASEANHYPGACSFTLGVLAPGRDMGHFPKSVCARVLGNSRDPPPGLGLPRDLARRELKKPSARGFSRLQPPASEPLPVKNMHPPARFQHQRQRPGSLPCSLLHQNSLRIMAAQCTQLYSQKAYSRGMYPTAAVVPRASGGSRCEVAAKRAGRRTSAGDAVDACATSTVVSSEEDVRAIEPCTPHAATHSATNYL